MPKLPTHTTPIYDFHINPDGEIVKDAYYKYTTQELITGNGLKIRYVIRKHTALVYKTPEQLDKFANGHMFTFEDNLDKARQSMIEYYQTSLAIARLKTEQCEHILKHLTQTEG